MKCKRTYSNVASRMCGRANDVIIRPHPTPPHAHPPIPPPNVMLIVWCKKWQQSRASQMPGAKKYIDPQKTLANKKTDNAEFDAYPVWSSAARVQTNIWQTTWQGKGNNLRTSRRENHSTQHGRKNLKRHIETSRHCGRKEKQGQRRERLIRKTYRQTATSDSAEFDA